MNMVLMLSALLVGGDPVDGNQTIGGNQTDNGNPRLNAAYYSATPIVHTTSGHGGFGAYEANSFDGYGWGYHTGNYSGWCPITVRSARNMGIWDTYCWETSICSCCGYENGSYRHITFCESKRSGGCGSCGHAGGGCGCNDHGYAGHDHAGAVHIHDGHSHGEIINGDEVPPPPGGELIPGAADGDAIFLPSGRYDEFLIEPGQKTAPASAPWIKNTNLQSQPLESADPPQRNWLFPRNDKPELPPVAPKADEKVTDDSVFDPFFTGRK